MKLKLRLVLSLSVIGLFVYLGIVSRRQPLVSAPPTSVKDVLSSSQLSYFARMGTGVSISDSAVKITLNSGSAPCITTNNLFVGDTIAIGTTGAGVGITGPLTIYTVKDIGNTATIELNSSIGQSNVFVNAAIIATRSAVHTISFTPQSNQTGGYWQFLIKASSRSGEVNNDGIPDQQGFDLGSTTAGTGTTGLGSRLKVTDVTCPNWGTGSTTAFSVGTTVAVGSNYYHVITCSLGAGVSNAVGVGYSAVIGSASLASGSQLINPAPSGVGRTGEGYADIYTFYIRHLDSSQNVIDADTFQGKIAVVEAVRVTATVDPSITFTIGTSNVGTGGTPCGLSAFGTNAANTTADSVAFGSLVLASFNDLAHHLSCVTNATNGYIVTVYEDTQMKMIGSNTTIPDTTCPSNTCSTTTTALWTTNTASGWGYAIQNVNLSAGSTTTDYQKGYRAFGAGAANAQTIMANTATPTTTEQAYICYRLTASTSQPAGNYENKLIYTATATF